MGEVLSRLCRRGHAAAVARALWRVMAAHAPVDDGRPQAAGAAAEAQSRPDAGLSDPPQGLDAGGSRSALAAVGSMHDASAVGALLTALLATADASDGGEAAGRALAAMLQGSRWEQQDSVRCVCNLTPHEPTPCL
jgi:hypothetical protein